MKKAPKYIQPAYKGTRAVLDHAISNTLSNRKPRTAFQRAVLKAVESIPRREARVPAFRKGWAAFCQLAGRTVGDHQTHFSKPILSPPRMKPPTKNPAAQALGKRGKGKPKTLSEAALQQRRAAGFQRRQARDDAHYNDAE